MSWIALIVTLVALTITIIGAVWTYNGFKSTKELKNLILNEKDMIRDKVLDIKNTLEKHREKVLNDRKIQNDQTLNILKIRIEDIESMIDGLGPFVERLERLK